ncbi:MAG: hypothetical protein QF570_13305 [Myxococcota bacterium]|nr:hypothetical protein [Myxococcota bacterium]
MSILGGLAMTAAIAANAQVPMPPNHPPIDQTPAGAVHPGQASANELVGTVTETVDASSYTYVKVDAGTRSAWAAAPRFPVQVGDRVSIPTHSPMQNYRSDSLGRTFPLVYFAERIRVASKQKPRAMANLRSTSGDRTTPHPSPSRAAAAPATTFEGISPPEGGVAVAEVFERASALDGQTIAIRGRVMKYSPRIMGTNWLHLQDGTSSADGRNDLVVTTDDPATEGDVVLVRGTLTTNRDFGHGYVYDVIVEGARVDVE